MTGFTEEDLKQYAQLEKLISLKADWKLSTAEAAQLYRSLVWYSQLKTKIEENILEIKKVHKLKKAAESEVKD